MFAENLYKLSNPCDTVCFVSFRKLVLVADRVRETSNKAIEKSLRVEDNVLDYIILGECLMFGVISNN
jgi:hypothetical protein